MFKTVNKEKRLTELKITIYIYIWKKKCGKWWQTPTENQIMETIITLSQEGEEYWVTGFDTRISVTILSYLRECVDAKGNVNNKWLW